MTRERTRLTILSLTLREAKVEHSLAGVVCCLLDLHNILFSKIIKSLK